ncbi:hypothetical protein HMPREF2932_06800 [Corynebacterium sp. HMSC074H12]|nr:hypothetical protein HMPREF2932_06800 [Corynebacterium sp. HMSC074H12]
MAACFVHGRFAFLRGVAAKVLSAREYELSRALGCYKVAGDRRYRRWLQGDWASGGVHGAVALAEGPLAESGWGEN